MLHSDNINFSNDEKATAAVSSLVPAILSLDDLARYAIHSSPISLLRDKSIWARDMEDANIVPIAFTPSFPLSVIKGSIPQTYDKMQREI